jgi:hypothetical protein
VALPDEYVNARTRERANAVRGRHVLAIAAILLVAVSMRATEFYTTKYQSLPAQDWLESRPPLAESADLPAASDLVRGIARALPLLTIRDDARPRIPEFGPPAFFQRTIGGVRDASRLELGTPGTFKPGEEPVHASMDVFVFNRQLRAAAWSQLMSRAMDIRDVDTGAAQARTEGSRAPEASSQAREVGLDQDVGVWIVAPWQSSGIATVVGHRGAVAFLLKVTFVRSDTTSIADQVDLSARAETLARQAAADWSVWLDKQLAR